MKKIAVIMGSNSDLGVVEPCMVCLKQLEIPFEVHVMSAHRTPQKVADFSKAAAQNGFGVIIAAAGKAAHLAGAIAANTVIPVIGIPVKASALEGVDALLSTVQMPPGIPVATVAINGAKNAAILAAQIIAIADNNLSDKLCIMRKDMEIKAEQIDEEIYNKYKGTYKV